MGNGTTIPQDTIQYKVKKGDTPSTIAQKYKVTMDKVLYSGDPTKLQAGATIGIVVEDTSKYGQLQKYIKQEGLDENYKITKQKDKETGEEYILITLNNGEHLSSIRNNLGIKSGSLLENNPQIKTDEKIVNNKKDKSLLDKAGILIDKLIVKATGDRKAYDYYYMPQGYQLRVPVSDLPSEYPIY